MKKQTKIIIGVVIAIAVVILVASLLYPPVFKGLTSGTFGKAEKYHKEQMTEKDIQLRSQFVQDTDQLRGMIQGLIYFSLFSQNLSYTIDTCVRAFQDHGICTEKNNACQNIGLLEDYSFFIKNNTKTLNTTIRMLTDFYLKDTADQSVDVEKNLRDFGNYVNQLNQRDSVVEQALYSMDGYLLGPAMKDTKKIEIAQLKSIRDQMLLKGVQLAGMIQDKPLCSNLLSYALSSQLRLSALNGQGKLDMQLQSQMKAQTDYASVIQSKLSSTELSFAGGGQLQEIMQASQVQAAYKGKLELSNLVGSVVVYDRVNLQFLFGNQAALGKLYSASDLKSMFESRDGSLGRLEAVTLCARDGMILSLPEAAEGLHGRLYSNALGNLLSSSELDRIISAQTLGSISYASNFIGMVNQLGMMGYVEGLRVVSDN